MKKILIVEDEIAIADLIKMGLESNGYTCEYALDGKIGADFIERNIYDLILLDIMLPKFDGYDLLEYIKPMNIPVIFITAKTQTDAKVKGLKLGADDYISKPFETDELAARVEAVLRRYNKGDSLINIENIEININSRTVKRDGKQIELTPREFDLLALLIVNKNICLNRQTIFDRVWGQDFELETRTLDLHIQRLRKKLNWKNKIKTIYKVGYMLEV